VMAFMLVVFILLLKEIGSQQTNPTDIATLIDFYNSTNGDSWTNSQNWLNADPCTQNWFGVTCVLNAPYYYVSSLSLNSNGLNGTIPNSIGTLTKLTNLDLNSCTSYTSCTNLLNGTIPTTIGYLTNLQYLSLAGNIVAGIGLNGTIPTTIVNLISLTLMEFPSNKLVGTIPTNIGNMLSLQFLSLYNNKLTGTIPTTIGTLTNLTLVELSSNLLTGTIPTTIGTLTNLQYLKIFNNQLSGSIPTIQTLTKLGSLDLSMNSFTNDTCLTIPNITSLNCYLAPSKFNCDCSSFPSTCSLSGNLCSEHQPQPEPVPESSSALNPHDHVSLSAIVVPSVMIYLFYHTMELFHL